MSIKSTLVSGLVRLYPDAWRSEYGEEFAGILMVRPVGPRVVLDVIWSACGQRARAMEFPTAMGLLVMIAVAGQLVWNIVAPEPWTRVVQPSLKLLPVVVVTPLSSSYFFALIVASSFLRAIRGSGPRQTGWAAVKICAIAGIPIVMAGLLIQIGALDLIVVGPRELPTTFREHGLAMTYYSAQGRAPLAINIMLAPLFRLGDSWLWGLFGGWIGSQFRSVTRQP